MDDITRDYINMGVLEDASDVFKCRKCGHDVLPWYLRCEACGDTSPHKRGKSARNS